jgi:hypothetical protein
VAFIPVTNVAEAALQFGIPDNDVALNVFNVKGSTDWTDTTLTELANALITWWYTGTGSLSYATLQHEQCFLNGVSARDLTTQTSPVVQVANTTAHQHGLDTTGPVNNALCKSITARSGLSGRSQRGRTFTVGIPNSAFTTGDQNNIVQAVIDDYVEVFNSLITAIPAANPAWSLVIVSRYHNGAPRAAGQTTPVSTFGYSSAVADFQRRRAPGHARHH